MTLTKQIGKKIMEPTLSNVLLVLFFAGSPLWGLVLGGLAALYCKK